MAKLLSELDVVRRNMDVMNEILSEVEPGKESADETQLLDVSDALTFNDVMFLFWRVLFLGSESRPAQHANPCGWSD